MLSSRLRAIADFIPENSSVIDVGCDHALLDIFLVKYKKCTCIASDINSNCLQKAIKNMNIYHIKNEIKILVSDGLNDIPYSNNDYIIISGMGFQTIKEIISNHKPTKMVIQSNTEVEKMRFELAKNYKIISEKIVLDKNKYYVVLYLEKGKEKYKYEDYLIGKDKNNINYMKYLLNQNLKTYKSIPKKYIIKKLRFRKKVVIIQKYLEKALNVLN